MDLTITMILRSATMLESAVHSLFLQPVCAKARSNRSTSGRVRGGHHWRLRLRAQYSCRAFTSKASQTLHKSSCRVRDISYYFTLGFCPQISRIMIRMFFYSSLTTYEQFLLQTLKKYNLENLFLQNKPENQWSNLTMLTKTDIIYNLCELRLQLTDVETKLAVSRLILNFLNFFSSFKYSIQELR